MILRVPLLLWALLLLEGNVIGQLLKVEDEFCARESPPRVTCPNPVEGAPPNPSSILEENVIRCYTSCIMSVSLVNSLHVLCYSASCCNRDMVFVIMINKYVYIIYGRGCEHW